jgi:hypothetical protein
LTEKSPGFLELPHGVPMALAVVVAVALAWRILVTGVDSIREGSESPAHNASGSSLDLQAPTIWRKRIARNPADYGALLNLALQLEREGRTEAARTTAAEALRLAPADQGVLYQSAFLYLRTGDEASGLATLRRFADLYPSQSDKAWPVLVAALDSGRHADFFARAARENPAWWPGFIGHACAQATVGGVQQAFTARVRAGLPTVEERRCVVARLQREGQWTLAYQSWLNSLPAEQRQRVGYLFNGGFETPLSNLGFDWLVPQQDGITVAAELTEGVTGKRALHVTFINKRYTGPPIYEYLVLFPGKYRFDGRVRADGLSSWLGMQWGLYCNDANGNPGRQLARSDAVVGSADWSYFQRDFVVSRDCPVQVLRLELANPQRDTKSAGNVAVRMRGSLWFDDLRVRIID